jgi:(S)-sulfolactate dehydrogenase
MRAIGYDPQIASSSSIWNEEATAAYGLDALFADADVVTLHVPLVDSTRHLIDAPRLARMKPGAILVNTARGGVVDEAAVATALKANRLGGAALDVFEHEPLPAGSPLAGCPNLLLTPHRGRHRGIEHARVRTHCGKGHGGPVAPSECAMIPVMTVNAGFGGIECGSRAASAGAWGMKPADTARGPHARTMSIAR